MADLRATFAKNVAEVEDHGRHATETLMLRLKRLTPDEFLREPRNVHAQLSLAQYREVVAAIAPEVVLPEPVVAVEQELTLCDRVVEFFQKRSAWGRSIYASAGAAIMLTLVIVMLAPLIGWGLAPFTLRRDLATETWPSCGRLDWTVDGCIYRTRLDLNWVWVAAEAQIDTDALRRLNHHLPYAYIPAGSQVVIWRGRGQLVRSGQ